jgi:hypothetical protein
VPLNGDILIGRIHSRLWVHLNSKESGFRSDEFFMSMETGLHDDSLGTISLGNRRRQGYSISVSLPDESSAH